MVNKTWNVRDQTEENLRLETQKIYKEIEAGYKLVKKVSNLEDAKKSLTKSGS